jgi:hypothetical protein
MVVSDTGVVVNGRPIVHYPSNGQALWVDRFDHYRFGGFAELDLPQSTRHSLTWWVMVTHGNAPEQRGDSTIFSFVDHGQASIAGVPMEKLTHLPHVGPGMPVRHENFIRYFSDDRPRAERARRRLPRPLRGRCAQFLPAVRPAQRDSDVPVPRTLSPARADGSIRSRPDPSPERRGRSFILSLGQALGYHGEKPPSRSIQP